MEGLAVMEMMDGAWISHFNRARVDFPLERGEHPLRKELAKAGCRIPTRSAGSCGTAIGCRANWRGSRPPPRN